MRRSTAFAGVLALLVALPGLDAQERPSFAGTWVLAEGQGGPPGGGRGGGRGGMGMMGGLGQGGTIEQDAGTLTLVRTTPMGEARTVYNLDGSPSTNRMTMGGGNSVEQVSRTAWDGRKLVITTSSSFGGNTFETTMSLALDDGGALVVETSGMGRGGGGGPVTLRYTRGS